MLSYTADPTGPVFISYRWSDGAAHAIDVARRLRASGVPVWLDRDDLPPGETASRLEEALASGISGAVLVATPDVSQRKSPDFIHDIEAPTILDDLAKQPRFTLVVLNTAEESPMRVDRAAPNRWYGRGDISGFTQYSSIDGTLDVIGRELATRRLSLLRANSAFSALTLDLQTRVASNAQHNDAELIFRSLPPETGRIPSRVVFEDLQRFLRWLPDVAAAAGGAVRLIGGAHLTVACALGAALPATTGIGLAVRATSGEDWTLGTARFGWRARLPLIGRAPRVGQLRWRGEGDDTAVLVDLIPTRSAPTFPEHLDEHPADFGQAYVVRSSTQLTPSLASLVVNEVVDRLAELAGLHSGPLHVFLRTPWGASVLLGSRLNTLTATLYEWDNTLLPPRYIKTITVAPGLGTGAITEIYMT